MNVRWILAACVTGSIWVGGASAAELEAILGRVEAAYGGADALRAVSGFRANGKILSLVDGVNGRIRMIVDLDGRMRTEIDYPSVHEVRILSHRLAWNGGVQNQDSSSPDMASSMRLQYHRLAAPFELVDTDHSVLEQGDPSSEGWARILRHWEDGSVTTYEIDPETGLIARVRGEIPSNGNPLEFVTESADFREVEGVMFPFRMTTVVSGQVAAETILDRVRFETEFVADDFLPTGSTGEI